MKRVITAFVTFAIVVTGFSFSAFAADFPNINKDKAMYKVYNYRSGDCWLSANTYMLKRKAVLQKNPDYSKIANDTAPKQNYGGSGVRSVGCFNSGDNKFNDMKTTYTYTIGKYSYTIKTAKLSGSTANKTKALKDALKKHPEGIAVWGSHAGPGYPHAVLLTDYSDNKFYCVDSAKNAASNNTYKAIWNRGMTIMNLGRTPLAKAQIRGVGYLERYMYISSVKEPKVQKCTFSYDLKGGTGKFPTTTVKAGDNFTITNTTPARSGYTFKGWYVRRLKDDTIYVSGKGWLKWSDIAKNGYKPRIYQKNETNASGPAWTGNGKGYDFKFYALWVPNGSKTVEDGRYRIVSALDNNMIMTVDHSQTTKGANVQINASRNDPKQTWDVKYLGNGCYSITNYNSGLKLDVNGGSIADGTNVQQWRDNGNDCQKWVIMSNGDGTYSIVSKCSGLYLDVSGCKAISGTNIHMWSGKNAKNQKWILESY